MRPKSVVPAVATTAIGTSPVAHGCAASAAASASRVHPPVAVGGDGDDGVGAEAQQRGRLLDAEVRLAGGEDPQPGPRRAPGSARGAAASSRASSSACRLDWVPPLVNTPSASGAEADPAARSSR